MDKRLALFVPVTFGIAFFLGIELGGFQLILLQAAQFFKLNNVMMGVLVTSQFLAITIGPLFFGWAADRYGKKTILLISLPLFSIGCFSAAFSGTVFIFICSVFISGMGYGVSECICSSALSDSFPGKESKYLNIMQCGFCLGAVLSPQIFSRLIDAGLVSWRAVFLSAGGGFVLIYPLLCFSHCRKPLTQETGLEHAEKQGLRIVSPLLFILLAGMLAYVAIETGVGFFADAVYVTEYSNTTMGAYAISGFWLAMTVSRFVFALVKMKMQNMILLGFSATVILLLLLLLLRNEWVLIGIFVLLGVSLGPIWPMIVGIGASSFREKSATVVSVLYASGGFGGVIIPVLIGWVSERAGFYGGFWLLAAASVMGFLLIWFGRYYIDLRR